MNLERLARFELASSAWKADILPLNYKRKVIVVAGVSTYAFTTDKSVARRHRRQRLDASNVTRQRS